MSFMTGSGRYVRRLMDEAGDDLEAALEAITQTLVPYVRACLDTGASGIFLAAVEWGSADNIPWDEYERFGRPYDLRVLESVQGAPLNVLHVCRDNNYLSRVLDYPVAAFHWDARGAGNPGFAEILSSTDKAVAGGVRTATMLSGSADAVTSEAMAALAETSGTRFLLAPGCSIDPTSPEANIRALVEAART